MKVYALTIALLLAATACVSTSVLQTARTMPPGRLQGTFGGGVNSFSLSNGGSPPIYTTFTAPVFEGGVRFGIVERLDMGLKLVLPGTIMGDVKFNFLSTPKFALAVGAGAGVLGFASSAGGGGSGGALSTTIIDLYLPVYASYDFSEAAALYLAPRFNYRIAGGNLMTPYAGATIGFKLGSTGGIYLETGYLVNLISPTANIFQANAAIFWGSVPAGGISGSTQ